MAEKLVNNTGLSEFALKIKESVPLLGDSSAGTVPLVGTDMIADEAVTEDKIDSDLLDNIAYVGSEVAGGTSQIQTTDIADGAVTADKMSSTSLPYFVGINSVTINSIADNYAHTNYSSFSVNLKKGIYYIVWAPHCYIYFTPSNCKEIAISFTVTSNGASYINGGRIEPTNGGHTTCRTGYINVTEDGPVSFECWIAADKAQSGRIDIGQSSLLLFRGLGSNMQWF